MNYISLFEVSLCSGLETSEFVLYWFFNFMYHCHYHVFGKKKNFLHLGIYIWQEQKKGILSKNKSKH